MCSNKPAEISVLPGDKESRLIDHLHHTCCPWVHLGLYHVAGDVTTEHAASKVTTEHATG